MDRATRGLWLALGGVALVPVSASLVALVPEGARVAVFLMGLTAAAAIAGRGGWLATRAFAGDTTHRGRAFAGAVLGLGLALTVGMIVLWTAIGLAVG